MSIVLNRSAHPVDLDDGRVVGAGEWADDVDASIEHNARWIESGHLHVLERLPVATPRPSESESAQSVAVAAPAPTTQPTTEEPGGNA